MGINKNNYEAYLLDLWEGNLSEENKTMLYAFLEEHPELNEEGALHLLKDISDTESNPIFDKAAIRFDQINLKNVEFFFIAYAEGDLSNDEMIAVEDFLKEHPALNQKFSQFQKAKLPIETIIYPHKKKLIGRKTTVISIQNRRWIIGVAAASVVFLFWIVSPFHNVHYKYLMTPLISFEVNKQTSDSLQEDTFKPIRNSLAVGAKDKLADHLNLPTSKREQEYTQNIIKSENIVHLSPAENKIINGHPFKKELTAMEETKKEDVPNEMANSLPAEIMEVETLANPLFEVKEEIPTLLDIAASYLQRKKVINEDRKPDLKGILNTTFAKSNDNKEPVLASSEDANLRTTTFQLGSLKVERKTIK